MEVYIVDTTLRDREQDTGNVIKTARKARVAQLLDGIGVYQIEAGVAAMGVEEMKGIRKIVNLGLKSKISIRSRLDMDDIEKSIECRPDIVNIAVPVSDREIENSPGKTKEWVVGNLRRCIAKCTERELAVTVGLEDTPRADMAFLLTLAASAFAEGAKAVRYYEEEGVTDRQKVFESIAAIRAAVPIEIQIKAHNRLGMAVSNSIAAIRAGAGRVECSAADGKEGADSCSLLEFIKSARACLGLCEGFDLKKVKEAQAEIAKIMK